MSTITYPHIEIDLNGAAIISGTTTKVIEIVQDQLARHWRAEDICRQYPYLSLAQVHAALTYYYDHEQAMDQEIERRRRRAADIKAERADDTIQEKPRRLGHLPRAFLCTRPSRQSGHHRGASQPKCGRNHVR
jgi:uncharacterized protein (DUF433 family)